MATSRPDRSDKTLSLDFRGRVSFMLVGAPPRHWRSSDPSKSAPRNTSIARSKWRETNGPMHSAIWIRRGSRRGWTQRHVSLACRRPLSERSGRPPGGRRREGQSLLFILSFCRLTCARENAPTVTDTSRRLSALAIRFSLVHRHGQSIGPLFRPRRARENAPTVMNTPQAIIQRGHFTAPKTHHPAKPDVFYQMVEQTSYPPFLDVSLESEGRVGLLGETDSPRRPNLKTKAAAGFGLALDGQIWISIWRRHHDPHAPLVENNRG
jgi:hypothetical protein